MSEAEDQMAAIIKMAGLPEPVRELVFAPPRRWRFDFAWVDRMIALEIEGGVFAGGRHVRGAAFEKDAEKYNAATVMGWQVYRVTTPMVKDGRALATIEKALGKAA